MMLLLFFVGYFIYMNVFRRSVFTVLSLFLLSCENMSEIDKNLNDVSVPQNWQASSDILSVKSNWLAQFTNLQLQGLVNQAIAANHQLKISAYELASSEQDVIISGSELWPELDLALQGNRYKDNDPKSYNNNSSAELTLSYELDIWGKLSASQRASQYNYLSQKADFEQSKQQLVVDVVSTWLAVIEAEKLLALYQKKLENYRKNLIIIESGYNSGLTAALDVYLTRNDLNSAVTEVLSQEVVKIKLVRQLERLVGGYPAGTLNIDAQLPLVEDDIPLGLPSDLISRKPSLKSSWYQLLAKDAGLAYAHKQRFPSIGFSASVGDSSNDVEDLFSNSSLAWSLVGRISAPIFNAGRLEANEEKARLALKQGEQQYLDTLYSAFSDVENAIYTEVSLKQSYQSVLAAQENAVLAATLSFEQYQSGLVSYTTVLDAQTRSYDAQTTLIKLKNQLIENRVNLHFALGGDFTMSQPEIKADESGKIL